MKKRRKILFCAMLAFFGIFYMAGKAEAEETNSLYEMIENDDNFGISGNCIYTYSKDKSEIYISGFNLDAEDIQIPDVIEGKKVTKIDLLYEESFGLYSDYDVSKSKIQSITFSKNIKTVSIRSLCTDKLLGNLKKYQVESGNPYFKEKDGVIFTLPVFLRLSCPGI